MPSNNSSPQIFQETLLPIFAGWMGEAFISHSTEANMPPFLPKMVKLSNKVQRNQVFDQEAQRFRQAHVDVCTGFTFPQGLASELHKMDFDMTDLFSDWHKGLGPGVAMRRDRNAVREHKKMHDDMGEYGHQIQFKPSDRLKLDTPTAIPPANIAEFLSFLRRYQAICQDWLSYNSFWTQTVSAVYETVQTALAQVLDTEGWYHRRGAHIIWKLVLEARQFFQIKRSYQDFAPVTTSPDFRSTAHSIVYSDVHLTTELPSCLQAIMAPSVPQPPIGSTQNSGGTNRGNRQQPRRNGRPSTITGTSSDEPSAPLVNPNSSQALVTLFSDLQLSDQVQPKAKRTASLLKEANLSMEQAQALLGLQPADCFNYHARGTCSRRNCPLQHTPRPALSDSTVASLLAQLQPAVERLKTKRRRGS
jgi:hypothetical protein